MAVWVSAGSDGPCGGEGAQWLDAARVTGEAPSTIHETSGLEEGTDKHQDHWAEAGMTLDITPTPWAYINPMLSQSFGPSSESEGRTPTVPAAPMRARASPSTGPRVDGDVLERQGCPRLGGSARVVCAKAMDGSVSPTSRATAIDCAAVDSTICQAAGGGGDDVSQDSPDGERGDKSGTVGTAALATPTATRARLVRAVLASGYAVSGSGMVAEKVDGGTGGDGKQGLAVCSGGKDGAGAVKGDENGGIASCNIRIDGDLNFSPTPARSHLGVEDVTAATDSADANVPNACEEGKSAVPDGRGLGPH